MSDSTPAHPVKLLIAVGILWEFPALDSIPKQMTYDSGVRDNDPRKAQDRDSVDGSISLCPSCEHPVEIGCEQLSHMASKQLGRWRRHLFQIQPAPLAQQDNEAYTQERGQAAD